MVYDAAEMAKADKRLRGLGIAVGLEDLGNSPALGKTSYVPQLLTILEESWSTYLKAEAIRAILSCSPASAQRRSAAQHALKLLDRHDPEDDDLQLLWGCFVLLIDDSFLEEVGSRALNPKFRGHGSFFCMALQSMKDPRAVRYLVQAAERNEIRVHALQALAKRDPSQALQLTSRFVKEDPGNRELRRLHEKLRKKLEGFAGPRNAAHQTRAAIPRSLATSSWNIDGEDIPGILRMLHQELPEVLRKDGVLEVESVVDNLELNRRARFLFPIPGAKKGSGLWLEILCDDEDSFTLEIASDLGTMARIESKVSKLAEK